MLTFLTNVLKFTSRDDRAPRRPLSADDAARLHLRRLSYRGHQ